MILDNPNIQRPLQLLLKEFPNYEKILSKCDNQEIIPKTDEWRYSKGDFYNPIPFRSEIDGFAPPRIIKKSYPSPDEASKNGVYASGFLNNALRVIRAPTDLPSVLSLSIYGENTISFDFNIFHVDLSKNHSGKNLPRLNGCSSNFKTSPEIQWIITVGRNSNFSVNMIELKDEKPRKELAFASGWNGEVEYFYNYDELGLLSITTPGKGGGSSFVWQRK